MTPSLAPPYDPAVPDLLGLLALRLPALLVAVTFHEFAHARIALAFGDHTAEREGRVTLNPLAHLDPIGTLGMLLGTFGWGRPVPVDPRQLRHPRADLFVSAAGPLMNLAIASLAGGLLFLAAQGPGLLPGVAGAWAMQFLYTLVLLNLGLGLFNLVPLFPLDGSHMLENLLPVEKAYAFKRFGESYGMPILFALIVLPMMTGFSPLWTVLGPPFNLLVRLLVPDAILFYLASQ